MKGLDLLGLAHPKWKLEPTIAAFPKDWAFGVFAQTFGDALPRVRQFLDSGKASAFRLQAWWDNAHRIADMKYLKKELPRWESLARQYSHIPFYISHSCEYAEQNRKEVIRRVSLVQNLCPSCKIVQTPMHSPIVKGVGFKEEHGSKATAKAGQIASTDGNEICQMNSAKWMQDNAAAELIFGWNARFNGRHSDTTEPPLHRDTFPNSKYIHATVRQMTPKGVAPVPQFEARRFRGNELYKVMAEDQKGDQRSNKPVIMLDKKVSSIDLVTFDNQVVANFRLYPDSNPHKLERYYSSGLWGYEIADRAFDLSGSEFVWIKCGKEFIQEIHPSFRLAKTYQ